MGSVGAHTHTHTHTHTLCELSEWGLWLWQVQEMRDTCCCDC